MSVARGAGAEAGGSVRSHAGLTGRPAGASRAKARLWSTLGPAGAQYVALNPALMPEEIDIYLDIEGATDGARAQSVQAWNQYIQILQATPGFMADWNVVIEDYARANNIPHPERHRASAPQGMGGQPGQIGGVPGMAGEPAQQPAGGGFAPQPNEQPTFAPHPKMRLAQA